MFGFKVKFSLLPHFDFLLYQNNITIVYINYLTVTMFKSLESFVTIPSVTYALSFEFDFLIDYCHLIYLKIDATKTLVIFSEIIVFPLALSIKGSIWRGLVMNILTGWVSNPCAFLRSLWINFDRAETKVNLFDPISINFLLNPYF